MREWAQMMCGQVAQAAGEAAAAANTTRLEQMLQAMKAAVGEERLARRVPLDLKMK